MKKFISSFNSKSILGVSLFAIAATLGMSGCNDSSLSCTVAQSGNSEVITCPDGSSTTIPNGQAGGTADPAVGAGISATSIPASDLNHCPQGNGGVAYSTFIDVNNTGIYEANDTITSTDYICNGATGATGAAGASSSVNLVAASSDQCANGGWAITVTNDGATSESFPICNGATGATGATGDTGATGATGAAAPTSPLTLVQLIAPCGAASSQYKEVLMLFSDGSLLADISGSTSADTVRLSLIPDGTYQDTDDSACTFQVSTSGSTREITWSAGSSSDDPSGWASGGWSWTTPVAAAGATPLN